MGFKLGLPSKKLSNVCSKGTKRFASFGAFAREALEERIGQDADIRPELTHTNEYLTDIRTAQELIEYSQRWINEYNAWVDSYNQNIEKEIAASVEIFNKGREQPLKKSDAAKEINSQRIKQGLVPLRRKNHIKKDAVVMCATIIKVPLEYMAKLSKDRQRKILLDGYDKLMDIVGANNVKAAVIHWDEMNPHLHVFWQPVTPDGRLCANDMHDMKFLGRLNREMPQYLRSCGWDIDDCDNYNPEEHKQLREELGDDEYRQLILQKRSKNGRSSSRYKYQVIQETEEAEKKLAEITVSYYEMTEKLAQKEKELTEIEAKFNSAADNLILTQQIPSPPVPPKCNRPVDMKNWLESNVHETNPFKRRKAEKEQTELWNSMNKPFVDYEAEYQKWVDTYGIILLAKQKQMMLDKKISDMKYKERDLAEKENQINSFLNSLLVFLNSQPNELTNLLMPMLPPQIREKVIEAQNRQTKESHGNLSSKKQPKRRADKENGLER